MSQKQAKNPFKPGAGHSPPHLAGRQTEAEQFDRFLDQDEVTQNVVLTGLRGVGKTVLMDGVYKPAALKHNWVCVGSDLSESAFIDERSLCQRLFTDLSVFTSNLVLTQHERAPGFNASRDQASQINYNFLLTLYDGQPGLTVDKLKAALEFAWQSISATGKRGVVFAYDEAQVVQDRKDKDQFPLALLLEVFQSLQKKKMRFMLLLTGLPTLFPKLVESRTYAERMFSVQEIGRLDPVEAKEAIVKPLVGNPIQFTKETIDSVIEVSKGYPYFIQFICREAYDFFKTQYDSQRAAAPLPLDSLVRKLDADFFAGRWSRVPDRQRELLFCIASLENAADEFEVNQIVNSSKQVSKGNNLKPFKPADVSMMLPKLIASGLLYKNRHGKYVLAVPLFESFIKRRWAEESRSLFDNEQPEDK